MAEKTVTLNAEEVNTLYSLLEDAIQEGTHKEPSRDDRLRWRLYVKLHKGMGDGYHPTSLGDELPPWLWVILHKTFAPDPVPPKPKVAAVNRAAKKRRGRVAAAKPAQVPKAAPLGSPDATNVGSSKTTPAKNAAIAAARGLS